MIIIANCNRLEFNFIYIYIFILQEEFNAFCNFICHLKVYYLSTSYIHIKLIGKRNVAKILFISCFLASSDNIDLFCKQCCLSVVNFYMHTS